MNGWYVVYLLTCFINGLALATAIDEPLKTPQFWVCICCLILAHIAGLER